MCQINAVGSWSYDDRPMKVVAGRHRRALNVLHGVWHSKEKWPAQGGFSANLPTHKDRRGREGRKELCPESRAFECM